MMFGNNIGKQHPKYRPRERADYSCTKNYRINANSDLVVYKVNGNKISG